MNLDFTAGSLVLEFVTEKGKRVKSRISLKALLTQRDWPLGDTLVLRGTLSEEGRMTISARPLAPCTLLQMGWEGSMTLVTDTQVFFNGWQSWTRGKESSLHEKSGTTGWAGLLGEKKYHFSAYGDSSFYPPSRRAGTFHGWTYSWFRTGEEWALLGSMEDHKGAFTAFRLKVPLLGRILSRLKQLFPNLQTLPQTKAKLWISRDVEGHRLDPQRESQGWSLLNVVFLTGREEEVFHRWFPLMGVAPRTIRTARGWTSWYKYYEDIDSPKILKALEGYTSGIHQLYPAGAASIPHDLVFQIDDGWQTRVGDWLSVKKERFPQGMGALASAIQERGMLPGLWLAPFAAHKDSEIPREHPDWLVKDQSGKPLWAGSNWGGFHALDVLNAEVQVYLRKVFHTVFQTWGFQLVKLDFLYAACLVPRQGLSRGEIMAFAMDLLRDWAGENRILGCGVPLASAFGRVEYCRIGCDVGLSWDGPWIERFTHRERVSTKNSLDNTRGRRHLNRRAFLNDPDVWIGRSTPEVLLTRQQKEILHRDNLAYGGLVFCSDDWEEIPPEWRTLE